jgi:hypothetical protein
MLKQFNSNARKLNRVVPKDIKSNTLDNDAYIAYLESIAEAEYAEHNTDIQKTNSKTRSNPNKNIVTNNKSTINDFYLEILQNSARKVTRIVDEFNNTLNTLTLYNAYLDYGTEGVSPNNFEILVYGLHIPGNFIIAEVGNNIVITLNDRYIDFDNVTINDIYVIGKIVDIPISTEDNYNLTTEDGLDIIL